MKIVMFAAALALAGAAIHAQGTVQKARLDPLGAARAFPYSQMTPHTARNGAVGRNVFRGTLATGESVAVHETMQPVGTAPNPPHRIHHSEIIVIQQGDAEFDHDGKSDRVGTGSILYLAYGTLHTVKNIGPGPLNYVVIQIGGDTGK